jgi:hypothetical protein
MAGARVLPLGLQPSPNVGIIQSLFQWPFQEPKLEVPTIYKAYVREYFEIPIDYLGNIMGISRG